MTPDGWIQKHLGEFAVIKQGFTFARKYQGISKSQWNYFKVADIGLFPDRKYLTNAINTIDDTAMKEIGCSPFPAGSIVFPRVGAALLNNNKKLLAQDSIVDDNVLVVSVTKPGLCLGEFLYYALSRVRLESWCNSGLVPIINSKTVQKQPLYLPPLAEQQKIADILSAQDSVIELKERLVTEKQSQKKYLMQRILTGKQRLPGFCGEWKNIALKEYGFCIRGVSYHPKEDLREGKTSTSCLLYRANNIVDGNVEDNNILFVDRNKVSSSQIIQQGDILISMSSGSKKAVGKSAYVKEVHIDSCVGAFCAIFRSPYNDYCRYLLSSPMFDKNMSTLFEGSNILNPPVSKI